MEGTVDDLIELRRLLATGSTPYIENIIRREIGILEEKFPDQKKLPAAKPQEDRKPVEQKPTVKSQAISSYAFLDSTSVAKIIVKDIRGLEQAKIEFTPEPHGFVILIIREEQNMPNLRLAVTPTKKIIPEQCKYTIKREQLTISLKKKKEMAWSKLKKQFVPKKTREESSNPNDNMVDMLRKMYDESDDEQKRSLRKALWEGQQKRKQKAEEDI